MNVILSKQAEQDFVSLPHPIKKEVIKQLRFLAIDLRHPSLRARKLSSENDRWEARVDYHYRFTFQIANNTITIRKIGPHDTGLGKK